MQHPVGYQAANKRYEMTDFLAVLTNPTGLLSFGHTVLAAYVVGAFFILGISAWHLLRKNEVELFRRSFRLAAIFGLVSLVGVAIIGDAQGVDVAATQPTKFAAMEAEWKTESGAPLHIIEFPDADHDQNFFQVLGIPGLTSFLAFHDFKAEVKGLNDFPAADRPPVALPSRPPVSRSRRSSPSSSYRSWWPIRSGCTAAAARR